MDTHAHLMLADHVEVAAGKLFVNGGGWNMRSAEPTPWGLAVQVFVPWSDMNRKFQWKIELVDVDGELVEFDTPIGRKPIQIEGDFKVGPNPHQKPGSQLTGLVGLNLPIVPLDPEAQFEFKMWINGRTHDQWRASFSTVAAQQQNAQNAQAD